MIKIFIGKRDYKSSLSVVLEFINNTSSRELTYSTNDMVGVDVYVYVNKLFSKGCIKEHSKELPKDVLIHINEGIGIYVDGEIRSLDVLEDYMRGM